MQEYLIEMRKISGQVISNIELHQAQKFYKTLDPWIFPVWSDKGPARKEYDEG